MMRLAIRSAIVIAVSLLNTTCRHAAERDPVDRLAGVWVGTPVVESVESSNKCLERTHDQWGFPNNPRLLSIERRPKGLHAEIIDFIGRGDTGYVCPYSGSVSGTSFTFTSEEDGGCGYGTSVQECGPNSGFQFSKEVITGTIDGSRVRGTMVETWNMQEPAQTPIVVKSRFTFALVGHAPDDAAQTPTQGREGGD